jgi:hypothetical protein
MTRVALRDKRDKVESFSVNRNQAEQRLDPGSKPRDSHFLVACPVEVLDDAQVRS